MSDIKLFSTTNGDVERLESSKVTLEKSLQVLIERHLEAFLGIRFLETEYSTGKTHGGRIDTLGIDENGCPSIIEYKRARNENVINQGLFYLDWLLDHKAEFELLVLKKFGQEQADQIEWSSPRLLCIAGDFTRYDSHAVQQINRNIELIRYIRFGEELLLLELVNAVEAASADDTVSVSIDSESIKEKRERQTVTDRLENASPELLDLYEEFKASCLAFGDDVQVKTLKFYIAFKRLKNFATVALKIGNDCLNCWLNINPDSIDLEEGFTRDVRNIGHLGTGDLEVTIRNQADLDKAMPLLHRSYEEA